MSWRGAPQQPAKPLDFSATFKRLLSLLLRDKIMGFGMLAFALLGTGLSVVGPKLLGDATNIIFDGAVSSQMPEGATKEQIVEGLKAAGHANIANMVSAMNITPGHGIDFSGLGKLLLVLVVLYAFSSLFLWLQGVLAVTAVQRTVARLRDDVEDQVNHLPLSYFDTQERGEILSRTTNDLDNLAQSLTQSLSQMVTSVLMVVGTLGMMLWVSPLLTLVALVTIPVAIVLTGAIMKRSQPQFVAQWTQTGRLNAHIEQVFSGHEVVKVFGHQAEAKQEFDQANDALFGAAFRAQFISGIIQPLMMFISNLNYVLVAIVGGLRVATGQLSIGDVQAVIQYSRQFTQPLTQLAAMVNLLQSGMASAERVFGLLDVEREVLDALDAPKPDAVRGRVEFDHVRFSYTDEPLISDLSLTVEPGHTVAIVGPTGAGKTTLTNLLLRFYELDGGRILLDGVDISAMRRDDLRSDFGVVLQDTWLFAGSIGENISYGATDASHEQMVTAAEAALVDHFVRTLPSGYESLIDAEGGGVSAGQRQLLTIARAFLADPAILILDEATSSVDTRTEALVQEAMERLRSGRTSFVIAHRLSTIRDANHIVVMEHGDIVEQGTHDELVAAGGAYQRLYEAQFANA
jgi:ATP-binding cassette, subfamily B, multidrug efflux pump